ncbi:oligoendopeptidase F [Ramlibacter sp. PS4R-6]|uniref:oligoendopeptidase F n=1 Tax=Ramlibacter sp. PS4R-6 TaxID=3133438 RepID=UPI0030AFFF4D
MRNRIAVATAAALVACATYAQTVDIRDTWNLAELYPSLQAWNAEQDRLNTQITDLGKCAGQLGASAGRFKQCLDLSADMDKRIARMYVYASEKFSDDTSVPANLELTQRAELLNSKLNESQAFMKPEILKIGRERIEGFLKQEPTLAIYRHPLDDILRTAEHTLDKEGEELVAKFGLVTGTGNTVYTTMTNADMPWPTIKLSTGEEVRLDASAYTKWREAANRADRKLVMDTFFGAHKTYEQTFGITLYSQLKEDMVMARVRKYPDSITAKLDANKLPVAVMDTLIAQANATLPTLHRYFRLRAKMLGVQEMRYYDIYPPLVSTKLKFPLVDAKAATLAAVAPLGADYAAAMRKGFDSRWMDVYPRKGKLSGAHMAGYAYDVHPYVLMNYNDDYESQTALAHEWGHAMHSYLSNANQPFATASYAIFVAEIASTLNEALMLDHMLKVAKGDDERLYYLGSALEAIRGTYYRQAMFGEFERQIHKRVDAGEALTGESFTKAYCEILKRYHGHDQGVVTIDDAYCLEWAYIPHFYSGFYVYQYATSIAASSLFAQRIIKKEPGALDKYVKLLKSGSSDYPYDLVKAAGVDLATPAPYQATAARMNQIMDEIEKILAKKR